MRITDRLRVEHGIFLRQLRTIEERLGAGASTDELRVAVDLLARAEHHHSQLEDRVFFPALAKRLDADDLRVTALAEEHAAMQEAARRIRDEAFGADDVRDYVALARAHFEHEIHGVFVLAEELFTADELAKMANWNVDHLFESMGRPAPWSRG